jgi:hypothetical protein
MSRRFRVPLGRTLTIPLELCPAPGAMHHQLGELAEIDIDDDRAFRFSRFLNNRLALGDLEEIKSGEADRNARPPVTLAAPAGGSVAIVTGGPAVPAKPQTEPVKEG